MPKIRNRVFATICASQFGFIEKTRFLTATRTNQKPGFCHNLYSPVLIYRKNPVSLTPRTKNPVSLTPVQAVRRCEIVDLICKLLMATHPTILNRCKDDFQKKIKSHEKG
jgi:hypothetical protein